ncbi:Protein prenyltransferase, alpha subunit [Penicillium expansum]|uniref:Geranylgeranyl transferase type-2 subunit alpha n=1 Tax=Penicillium expansum TaxID=27334 RepID=A0A0A2IWC0_PENEN|nr:Protein prenyltransferase, alpha subunit [Penicillium expansum]KGO36340.1 Protein prenyltransferase, alpha subunit [Penicillium expansum]KGO47422.1 Protein prenyltransferase, alpha subunit [Penicillium expansum]KGO52549.1 Protein prenyltransferase, alpha subunit [Penicillium expansum]
MPSHGVPRYKPVEKSPETRQQELQKIENYRNLELLVAEHEYTIETLKKISELLSSNPEYYTAWNYRRKVLQYQFSQVGGSDDDEAAAHSTTELIVNDLHFLIPLLRSFPKCYWIWNYRLWLLDEARRLLPLPDARAIWQQELALVGKMLTLDSRNFHGWGHRRFVVETLKELVTAEEATSMTQKEFEYAKKMIGANLSNFSAWHYRTKLIQSLLDEQTASDDDRRRMLDDELSLIHQAFIDPYDQSLWFYHQNLMSVFDPSMAERTMAPNLSSSDRLEYIRNEIEEIKEMLDGAEDCKYIYQALIEYTILASKVEGSLSSEDRDQILSWLAELKKLDPLRRERWLDFEKTL